MTDHERIGRLERLGKRAGCCFQQCRKPGASQLVGRSAISGQRVAATYCRDHLWYMWGYCAAKEWTDLREVPL